MVGRAAGLKASAVENIMVWEGSSRSLVCWLEDCCWSWSSNTLATWCEELTHWKRPWERLRAGGDGGNRGWDGWMASLTQQAWIWANSRGDSDGQGRLTCCSPWGCKESDMTEHWTNVGKTTTPGKECGLDPSDQSCEVVLAGVPGLLLNLWKGEKKSCGSERFQGEEGNSLSCVLCRLQGQLHEGWTWRGLCQEVGKCRNKNGIEAILRGWSWQDLAVEKGHGVREKGRERQGQPTGFWLRKKRGCSWWEKGGFVLTLAALAVFRGCPIPHLSRGVPHYSTARTYCPGRSSVLTLSSVGCVHPHGKAWGSLQHPLWKSFLSTRSFSVSPSSSHQAVSSALANDTNSSSPLLQHLRLSAIVTTDLVLITNYIVWYFFKYVHVLSLTK